MKIIVYVRSNNEALASFSKNIEWLTAAPKIGESILFPPKECLGKLCSLTMGEVTDVRPSGGTLQVLVRTQSPTTEIREYLIPQGWSEISFSTP